ncbi:Cof-type HAD-IIB family hydrolase [Chloroflexota bacterium]
MYKLLALDLDGTLIGKDLTISPRTKNAINQLMSQGVTITIATGRMFQSALPFAQELNISTPLICYEGAMIADPGTNEILWHKPVPLKLARRVIEIVTGQKLHINVYLDDELYVKSLNDQAKLYASISRVEPHPVGNLLRFLDREPTKLVIVGNPDEIDGIKDLLKGEFETSLYIAKSYPRFCEVAHPECNKGNALAMLSGWLGIAQSEVVAIGDNPNDIDMVEWAGTGIAMTNGTDEVKEVADWITGNVKEDGVAQAIEKYFKLPMS